ncbi:unnamed protein product, partial [marine sediment metagenome]
LFNAKALFELASTTKGFLMPRMTTAQRVAMVLAVGDIGLKVYDTDLKQEQSWDGATWVSIGGDIETYPYKMIYVSLGGDDGNDGSQNQPLKTMAAAWALRKADNGNRYTIKVDAGIWDDTLTLDVLGSDEETYIQGLQDGTTARWASGASNIVMTDAGNVYFVGYGYYTSLSITQTGTNECTAKFVNIWVYGSLTTTVNDSSKCSVETWGTNGWIDVNNGGSTVKGRIQA